MSTLAQSFTQFEAPNKLQLESGQSLGPVTQAYHTFGTLNANKDNAILVCHALSGDSNAQEWWSSVIGPQKALDTDRYYIVCPNTIGSCKGSTGPASIDPETNSPYGTNFPVITIGDMVHAQKALMDYLDIPIWKMVIGGSMGGMQALEWVSIFPELVQSCVPIAATSQVSPQAIAFDAVGRSAITQDSEFQNGQYYQTKSPHIGLATARMIGHITYLSESSMDDKFGRNLQDKTDFSYNFDTDFQIESYLKHQGDKFGGHFDANSYLYLTKAISYFDLIKKYGSLEDALDTSSAKFLIIAITSDWLYTPKQSKKIVNSLMKLSKDVTYVEIDAHYGHDSFLIKNDDLSETLRCFTEQL